ncbi:MAG: hypothetical protein WBA22_11665 [Candidatus Methanofastidiosia archaeon]
MGELAKAARNMALGKHLEIYVPYVREILPGVIAEGLNEQDWMDLKLMVNSRNSTDCRYIIIGNLGKLNFLETFFRLRVLSWQEEEIDSFLKPLKDSLLLSLATLFKLMHLSKEKVREWDETIKQEEFESVKKLLYKRCVQNRLIKLLSEVARRLIPFLILVLLIYIIWILKRDLSVIERFLSLMGAVASIISLSYIFAKKG